MLDEDDYDGVYLTVRADRLRNIVKDIAKRKIPVFTEKPPGTSSKETQEMAAMLGDTPCLVAFNRRFMPLNALLIEKAAQIKDLVLVECQFYRSGRKQEDFAFGTGIHGIDMMVCLGGKVASVTVEKEKTPGKSNFQYLLRFQYASGARGLMKILPEVGSAVERYAVHGDGTSIYLNSAQYKSVDLPGRLEVHKLNEIIEVHDGAAGDPIWKLAGVYDEAKLFIQHLLDGRPMHPAMAECVTSMRIAERAVQGKGLYDSNKK
jgi:predicted dehydrogenase